MAHKVYSYFKLMLMKTIKYNNGFMKFLSMTLLIAIAVSVVACSQKIPFQTSSVVPSAEGEVKVKSDNNKNYIIELSVMRLAEPERLTPPKLGYIVWMETEKNGVKNIGQLKTSTGFMSKNLTSSLTTVTPFKPIGFFISGEDDITSLYPSLVVLRTGTFSMK